MGNCINGTFQSTAWNAMLSTLNQRMALLMDIMNLSKRFKVLKQLYSLYCKCASNTGWGWDDEKKLSIQGDPIEWDVQKIADVLKKGTGGYKKVVGAFGDEILLVSGDVDRARLGQIVFSNPSKRQLLNRYCFEPLSNCFSLLRDEMKENGRTIEDNLKFKGRS
ncbi:hypothetical protein QJS04_geneDACA022975 [Acorus gramineus]|uniref:Myb/SANT-like domain-containing protein n=1 Tax=Acorus gramineus TaxID=55184 RepID=A0AAV9A045_ACOGR|nr:hypothetical protein QJS04_geneDACA022975 [Acorus gramineus]